ncbi:phosphoglycerol transferase MdoB-like AlkP superfamily enzyme [Paraburkholderia eburnea]|uniref:Phosphoglycerol transferase MdoB-like AlkP superfamily enzyme n=1 Tax=Paraburkholderia eburnea TaxID=1189126 RepID=A0A2S4MM84_9BURK|nr:phosphoglycerol transferase MdoB-like AlkP superfamily enzyme [Paraburkholderia eburnea]PRZ27011.1 phosphoglycerol transferase MdoB-like AlkP superfamily enzyme [Paraburkholderia eburnea]
MVSPVSIPLAFVCAAALSFAADAIAFPRVGLRRTPGALALHIVSVVFVACLICALTRRPFFSAFIAVAVVGLMSGVSNAKYASLREPFVFTDLSLFSQLFAHPRLYLPFLSVQTVIAIVAGVLLLAGGFFLDAAAPAHVAAFCALAAAAFLIVGYALAARLHLTLDPIEDQRRHGFFAVFVAYLLNGMRRATFRGFESAMSVSPFAQASESHSRPDIIVIQSESFFDARESSSAIESSLYTHFDTALRESTAHGQLDVPAWGANTMRSEFALLSGISSAKLGYARFYPYAFVRRACASLVSWFHRAGYETLAIHPYYADFFGRDRVFPLLGFDRFLDIRAFANAHRAGPYISDESVTDRIVKELDSSRSKPAFIFAMTMENHGPLHLETVEKGESSRYHNLGEDPAFDDLTAYLRHIANADAMIGRLLAHLRARRRDTVLCFYGDHVPALPHVFERLGTVPSRSHYFIWRNFGDRPARKQDRAVEDLGAALLHTMESADRREVATGESERTEQL